MNSIKIALPLAAILLFGGCSFTPKLQDVNFTMPADMTEQNLTINSNWWEQYNDPKLNALIEEGLKNNKDLQIAMLNIESARVSLRLEQAEWLPTINAQGGASRQKSSQEAYTSSGVSRVYNDFSLSAVLSYEIDLWGKVASSNKAARAALLASKASADTVRLSLSSSIADYYFALISYKEQLEIANQAVKTREDTVNLTQMQVDAGSERESVLSQQKSLLAQAKITRDAAEQNLYLTSSALGILLGRQPASLLVDKEIITAELPSDIVIPEYIPSSILAYRPDIESSYQQLIASNEQIGISRAAYFPSISISGLLGLQSANSGDLLQSSAKTWNLGGSLIAPLIDFGRTSNNVELAKIQKDISVLNYESTVLTAFGEVYDALNNRRILLQNLQNALDYESSLQRTLDLVTEQYNAGYTDYLSVLDSERSLLNAKISTVSTKQSLLSSGVSLFKALGGGWNKETYQEEYDKRVEEKRLKEKALENK